MLFCHEPKGDSVSDRTVEEIGNDSVWKIFPRFLEAYEREG